MEEIHHKTAFSMHRRLNLEVNENHTNKYGNKSLRCLGPHIWNSLPNQIKRESDYTNLRDLLFFFDVSAGMSILYCQYNLGFDPFLVGNGFPYFCFCLTLLTLFVICELYITYFY